MSDQLSVGPKLFGCVKCEVGFTDADTLQNHGLSCPLLKPYFCLLCRVRFSDISNLSRHTKNGCNLNSDSIFQNQIIVTKELNNDQDCVNKEFDSFTISYTKENVSFNQISNGSQDSLPENKITASETECLKCFKCSQEFLTHGDFIQHFDSCYIPGLIENGHLSDNDEGETHNVFDITCEDDSIDHYAETIRKDEANSHFETVVDNFKAGIPIDNSETLKKEETQNQLYVNSEKRKEPEEGIKTKDVDNAVKEIESCFLSYQDKNNTKKELDEKPQYTECTRIFSNEQLLLKHKKSHNEESKYKCSQCNSKFRLKKHLLSHERSHEHSTQNHLKKTHKHVCNVCSRGFARATHLRLHQQAKHSKLSSQVCQVCGKTFDTRRQLANHMRSHNDKAVSERNKDIQQEKNHSSEGSLLEHRTVDCIVKLEPLSPEMISSYSSEHIHAYPTKKIKEEVDHQELNGKATSISKPNLKKDGVSLYSCGDCSATFKRLYHLKRHSSVHSTVKPFECPICQKKFKSKEVLQKHKKIHKRIGANKKTVAKALAISKKRKLDASSSKSVFQCDKCNFSFLSCRCLKHHQQIHMPAKFRCKDCDKSFKTKQLLIKHKQSHRGRSEKKFLCDICGTKFGDQSWLKKHKMIIHSNIKPYKCDVCEKQFKYLSSFKSHKHSHTGLPKSSKCSHCEKSFMYSSELKKHMRDVHLERQFQCFICGKKFARKEYLSTHTRMVHLNEGQNHQCDQCDRLFKSKSNLTTHIKKVHEEGYSTTCELCQETFTDKFLYRQHIEEHDGKVRAHSCDQCTRKFKDGATLKRHKKLLHHKGEKHNCPTCDAKFTFVEDLHRHQLKHSMNRQYVCPVCKVRFLRKYHLERHFKAHELPPLEEPAQRNESEIKDA